MSKEHERTWAQTNTAYFQINFFLDRVDVRKDDADSRARGIVLLMYLDPTWSLESSVLL